MTNDNVDITEPNFIGAVDRITTNIALAGLALIPSIFIVAFTPWRLPPLIKGDTPEGRDGVLLAPGIFFLMIMTFSMLFLVAAAPELAVVDPDRNGSNVLTFSQNELASLKAGWQEGEVYQVLQFVMPVYILTIAAYAALIWLRFLIGPWWTMRSAVRLGFYQTGAIFGLISGIGGAVLLAGFTLEQLNQINTLFLLTVLAVTLWNFFWVFKSGGASLKQSLMATVLGAGTVTFISGLIDQLQSRF